ncbi:hypothetical protein [Pacificispira sp.]|uniref:hypothetical protein n=1 Tax=Pacificispira sp. TaxID=2888761 RepID=UPI003BAA3DF8
MGTKTTSWDGAAMILCGTAVALLILSAFRIPPAPPLEPQPQEIEEAHLDQPSADRTSSMPVAILLPAPPAVSTPAAPPVNTAEPARPVRSEPIPVEPLKPRPRETAPTRAAAPPAILRPVEPIVPEPPKTRQEDPPPPKTQEAITPPAPQSETEIVVSETAPDSAQTLRQGRALLRLLEQDAGPDLRIAWPADGSRREALYAALTACFGMESVLMDGTGRLYRAAAPAGVSQPPDMARHSGFVRAVEGEMPRSERQELDPIYRHHRLSPGSARPVRLFPRHADAMLLGGLSDLLGGLRGGQRIEARYTMGSGEVAVTDIRRDGTVIPGSVRLRPRQNCRAAT